MRLISSIFLCKMTQVTRCANLRFTQVMPSPVIIHVAQCSSYDH